MISAISESVSISDFSMSCSQSVHRFMKLLAESDIFVRLWQGVRAFGLVCAIGTIGSSHDGGESKENKSKEGFLVAVDCFWSLTVVRVTTEGWKKFTFLKMYIFLH